MNFKLFEIYDVGMFIDINIHIIIYQSYYLVDNTSYTTNHALDLIPTRL